MHIENTRIIEFGLGKLITGITILEPTDRTSIECKTELGIFIDFLKTPQPIYKKVPEDHSNLIDQDQQSVVMLFKNLEAVLNFEELIYKLITKFKEEGLE